MEERKSAISPSSRCRGPCPDTFRCDCRCRRLSELCSACFPHGIHHSCWRSETFLGKLLQTQYSQHRLTRSHCSRCFYLVNNRRLHRSQESRSRDRACPAGARPSRETARIPPTPRLFCRPMERLLKKQRGLRHPDPGVRQSCQSASGSNRLATVLSFDGE